MAWLFGDSFDHYTAAQATRKWNVAGDYRVIADAPAGRYGTACARFGVGGTGYISTNYFYQKTLDVPPPSSDTFIFGSAFKIHYVNPVYLFGIGYQGFASTGTVQMSLRVNGDLTLSAVRSYSPSTVDLGTTTFAMNADVWYYIEMKCRIHSTLGTVEIRVNGVPYLTLTNQNTQNLASNSWNVLRIGYSTNVFCDCYMDDLYLLDGTDSGVTDNPLNDFLGDTRAEAILPNANGANSGFTGSDGNSTDNYALVNENPATDETGYVAGQSAGTKDTYGFPAMAGTGAIRCVQHLLAMRKTDTALKAVRSVVRTPDDVDRDSTDPLYPGQITYDYYRWNYPARPGSGIWLKDDLTNTEFGQKVSQ